MLRPSKGGTCYGFPEEVTQLLTEGLGPILRSSRLPVYAQHLAPNLALNAAIMVVPMADIPNFSSDRSATKLTPACG